MCGSSYEPEILKWSKEWPQEPGEYLWIRQWSCGCVIQSGICWVFESFYTDDRGLLIATDDGEVLGLSWESDSHPDELEDVQHWARINLPKPNDSEEDVA